MEQSLDSFFERQRQERANEIRLLNQTSLTVQMGCENNSLTQMLSDRIEITKIDCSNTPSASVNTSNTSSSGNQNQNFDLTLDQFFESQRAQRISEVERLASQIPSVYDRRFVLKEMLQRSQVRRGGENETTISELESVMNAQTVRTLLTNTFRTRLENALRAPPQSIQKQQNNRSSRRGQKYTRRSEEPWRNRVPSAPDRQVRPVIPTPPAPPVSEAPQPVGWQSVQAHMNDDRVVRSERFDVFSEISSLISEQIVTQTLNSIISDLLESHLQHRIELAPSVFTWEAREESMRTLNNLPRHQRARNDFSDIGIVDVPTTNGRRFAAAVPPPPAHRRPAARRGAPGQVSESDERIERLESMMESMQNLLTRQTSSQAQLESAIQQVILNQTLLSTNATGISVLVQPESAGKCAVCLDESRPVDNAFYRCGHVIACTPCAAVLLAVNLYCPLCRQKIDDVIKLYKLT
ncbi:uncharacterized protein LOC134841676 [Symsagittifera roscoffensis]|uniref:uncharacterized protein LOC134841676 n=1 Tax=Symsagittifera roscoffensis TaxID=84072 RepID=UPI00307C2469